MANKKQKQVALKQAIQIAREYARGGSEKSSPDVILDQTYKRLIQIMDDIEQTPENGDEHKK